MINKEVFMKILNSHLESEKYNVLKFEKILGKNRNGFCDFGYKAINLLFEAQRFVNNENIKLDENDCYANFSDCLRVTFYYILHRVSFTFSVIYDLTAKGYYTEAIILLRSIFENVISIKYVIKREDIILTTSLLAGSKGFKGNKFKVTKEALCNDISPRLYQFYRDLCEYTHVSLVANLPNVDLKNSKIDKAYLTVRFDERNVGLIVNQLAIYLLYLLNTLKTIFPEVIRDTSIKMAFKDVLEKLKAGVDGMDENNFEEFKKILT